MIKRFVTFNTDITQKKMSVDHQKWNKSSDDYLILSKIVPEKIIFVRFCGKRMFFQ